MMKIKLLLLVVFLSYIIKKCIFSCCLGLPYRRRNFSRGRGRDDTMARLYIPWSGKLGFIIF